MCDKNRVSCDVCRTINLAKHVKQPKPEMHIYDKCTPVQKFVCPTVTELPLKPTCIKICTKEEYKIRKTGHKPLQYKPPYYGHGKCMYAVKAGILAGSIYFTYTQGIWGDQREVTECLRRWSEYIRSLNTRRPPTFDHCGNVIKKDSVDSLLAPVYNLYKSFVTTCFSGVVKVPLLIKCAYLEYLKELERKHADAVKERQIRKRA
ncbi:unnamed protein product [Arctia plantaginis]|uniref:MICOS complex subunit MIC13 n=1 Tax=Arctia plantaginis TaxID=874455 RepID=A0A8S1AHH9_ARCPL|nr:unnamed protein product [Arctia plantaginis]CAB3248680.1 unnamed protein product [Arctia plantaginis]